MCQLNDCITAEVQIVNRQGLHARPVMKFVDLAGKFQAEIIVDRGDGTEQVDGKSPMHMMLLAAPLGASLRIQGRGVDADAAVRSLVGLVEDGFGEA